MKTIIATLAALLITPVSSNYQAFETLILLIGIADAQRLVVAPDQPEHKDDFPSPNIQPELDHPPDAPPQPASPPDDSDNNDDDDCDPDEPLSA